MPVVLGVQMKKPVMVVSFVGFNFFLCRGRTSKRTQYEEVPVGMKVVAARTWHEAKEKMAEEMEKYRPQQGLLEIWSERRLGRTGKGCNARPGCHIPIAQLDRATVS